MTAYSIDQIALHRLNGWEAEEWVYISTIGQLKALGKVSYIEPAESYAALHGMNIMILCSQTNPAEAYEITDRVLEAGAHNLAVWVVEWPRIAELVFYGHRFQTPKAMPMSSEFKCLVTELSEGLAA